MSQELMPPGRENEFAFTTWEFSCRDPRVVHGDLRECRRAKKHDGPHASGFDTNYREWGLDAK